MAASGFSMLAAEMIGPVYAVFVEEIGGDLSTAGYAYGLLALVAGVVTFFMGHFASEIGHERWLVVVGYSVSALGILGYIFVSEPLHLYLVQVAMGLGSAIRSPSYDSLYSKNLQAGRFAAEWGMWETMYWLATAVSAAAGGWIAHNFGFDILFSIMFVLALVGVVSASLLLMDHDEPLPDKND